MNMKNAALFSMILGLVITVTSMESCKKSSPSSTPTSNLYDTLGGTALVNDPAPPDNGPAQIQQGRLTVRDVIDSTIFVIAGDDSINRYFAVLLSEVGANNLSGFDSLSRNLTDFVSVAAGATAYTYTGLSMPMAHNPSTNPRIAAAVTSGAFSEFINDVAIGATKVGASTMVIGQVAAKLEPVEPSVINQ
jgi:hypothetical protein